MPTWSSPADTAPETIRAVQAGLTVRLAMTPRSKLMTCSPVDIVASIATDNVDRYSVLPVLRKGRICGLYNAERWFGNGAPPEHPIGNDFERLREEHLIGADASILDFVTTADTRPTRLVVAESGIVGLVCLADLHRLPVRAALFSVVTALEIAMADRIQSVWPDRPDDWLNLLSAGRRCKVLGAVKKAKQGDTFVNHVLSTQLSDKATIIRKKGLLQGSQTRLEADFQTIQGLRDNLAHANDYATTNTAAQEVPRTVAMILRFIDELRGDDANDGLR